MKSDGIVDKKKRGRKLFAKIVCVRHVQLFTPSKQTEIAVVMLSTR